MFKNLFLGIALLVSFATANGQSLDLTVKNYGLSIGDSREVRGVRLNFRDRRLRSVVGLNATIWSPRELKHGEITGLALGLPSTGGEKINGVGLGVFGVGARRSLNGLMISLVGLGAGEKVNGIAIGGIGLGSGEGITGFAFGGIGLGSGGDLNGIMIGGVGLGSGGDIRGISIGGVGLGSGRDLSWVNLGGIGVGAGRDIHGFSFAFVGVGAGRAIKGLTVAGVGIGSGREIKGITIAGAGIGSPKITGLTVSLAAGAEDFTGVALAPAYFRIEPPGELRGVSVSAWNQIKGTNSGLSIGIINISNDLRGLQLGLLNIAHSNPKGLKVLPIFNTNFN